MLLPAEVGGAPNHPDDTVTAFALGRRRSPEARTILTWTVPLTVPHVPQNGESALGMGAFEVPLRGFEPRFPP